MRVQLAVCAAFSFASMVVAPPDSYVQAQTVTTTTSASSSSAPLVLAKQGSFFVNPQSVSTNFATAGGLPPVGSISTRGMYVQYQIPASKDPRAYPVIMVHGSSHTAKTFEETPDGRMGWAEYFVRHGIPVYVVEHAGRGRSGFDPTPTNQAAVQGNAALVPNFTKFTNETAWVNFRIGPAPFTPYANSRFPVAAREQYFAQIIPNTETSYPEAGLATVAALVALVDQIGPAVVLVHSQSGSYGLDAAMARPTLVKAVVSVEPRGCAVPDAAVAPVFSQVKLLTMFGDFQGTSVADWPGREAECLTTVSAVQAAGGTAENINLPERGIYGNSHMMMLDLNNLELADMILAWIAANAPAPAN